MSAFLFMNNVSYLLLATSLICFMIYAFLNSVQRFIWCSFVHKPLKEVAFFLKTSVNLEEQKHRRRIYKRKMSCIKDAFLYWMGMHAVTCQKLITNHVDIRVKITAALSNLKKKYKFDVMHNAATFFFF